MFQFWSLYRGFRQRRGRWQSFKDTIWTMFDTWDLTDIGVFIMRARVVAMCVGFLIAGLIVGSLITTTPRAKPLTMQEAFSDHPAMKCRPRLEVDGREHMRCERR